MIRKANVEDSSRMAEIHVFGWRSAYNKFISLDKLFGHFSVKNRTENFKEYLTDDKFKDGNFVFEEENIIKAILTMGNCRDKDKNEKTYELMGIYVDPIFQRQKIGSKLVDYCIKEAVKNNKEEITLWVFEKNIETIKFYEKMGFKKEGKKEFYEYYNENAIRMNMKI